MSEIRLLIKLAKVIKTPQEAAILLAIAAAIILLAYAIPPEVERIDQYIN